MSVVLLQICGPDRACDSCTEADHPETGRKRGLRHHRTIRGLHLKDIKLLRAFIYAPDEIRIQNIMKSHSLSESDAKILLLEKDKRYHKRHLALTGSNRGDRHNRDILINSAFLGVEGTAEYLEELIQKKYGSGEE